MIPTRVFSVLFFAAFLVVAAACGDDDSGSTVDAGGTVDGPANGNIDARGGPDAALPDAAPLATETCGNLPATLGEGFLGNNQTRNVQICVSDSGGCWFSNKPACEQLLVGAEAIIFGRNVSTDVRFVFPNNGWILDSVSEPKNDLPADTEITFVADDGNGTKYEGKIQYTDLDWTLTSFGVQ